MRQLKGVGGAVTTVVLAPEGAVVRIPAVKEGTGAEGKQRGRMEGKGRSGGQQDGAAGRAAVAGQGLVEAPRDVMTSDARKAEVASLQSRQVCAKVARGFLTAGLLVYMLYSLIGMFLCSIASNYTVHKMLLAAT